MRKAALLGSLLLVVMACGGRPTKHDHPHDQTLILQPECDEAATSGSTGQAASGSMGPAGTTEGATASTTAAAPTPAPDSTPNTDAQGNRLPMGPDMQPCRSKSGTPSPVAPTAPPPAPAS